MVDLMAIAHVCYEANRALQIEQNRLDIPIGMPWEELSIEQKESIVVGVEKVLAGNSPMESHHDWVAIRVQQGWVWGPIKDEAKKQHPLLVPYADLSEQDRRKDYLFCAIVHALADTIAEQDANMEHNGI